MRKPKPAVATKIPGKVPPMPPAKPMSGPQKATKIKAFESSAMDKKMDMKGMKSMGKKKGG
jgi:hypothetical protein